MGIRGMNINSFPLQVLMVLTDDSESRSHREDREQALLELLQTQGQGHDYFDRSCLIERAEKAGFYRVLERIYEEDGRWEDVLGTFLSDRGPRKHQVVILRRLYKNLAL